MEESVTFFSEGLKIEGLLNLSPNDRKASVITHPHPLYGGDMYNAIVESVTKICRKNGYATLRFNFRGTGNSNGDRKPSDYSRWKTMQQDVLSAIHFIKEKGIDAVSLAGYSFGAWVNAHTNFEANSVQKMLMVSPPVTFMQFEPLPIPSLELVIAGSRDDIGQPDMIRKMIDIWNPGARLEIINDADHFYSGCTHRLESILTSYLS